MVYLCNVGTLFFFLTKMRSDEFTDCTYVIAKLSVLLEFPTSELRIVC